MSFPYTASLAGYDTYLIHMWGDFALTQLTLMDSSVIPQPQLHISLTASNYVRLNWPTNANVFTLLEKPNLIAGIWIVVTNAVSVAGTNQQVTVPRSSNARFFRLVF